MNIWQSALDVEAYVIRCRRHFHQYPELSDREDETVAYILNELRIMGISCEEVPQGGVMGYIDGACSGKTVLLRADIDALPMQEQSCNEKQPKYASASETELPIPVDMMFTQLCFWVQPRF